MPAALTVGSGLAVAGGASAAGGILSGILGSSASKKAASTQAAANTQAAQLQMQMYQQTAQRLQPWVDQGQTSNQALGGLLGLGSGIAGQPSAAVGGFQPGALATPYSQVGGQFPQFTPFQPTMSQLEQTPGYQFVKGQGTQATTNAAAAMGLGDSGSLLKGIDTFTTGLASTTLGQQQQIYMQNYQQQAQTYQQQFSNYWQQLGQVYNMLSGQSTVGENAAAGVGAAGTSAAASGGNFLSAAGANQAAGIVGGTSAITGAVGTASNLPLQLAMLQQIGQYGSGGGAGNAPLPIAGSGAANQLQSGGPLY